MRCDAHSESVAQYVSMYFPLGIDFIFLDADHTYEGVKREYGCITRLLASGRVNGHCWTLRLIAESFNVQAGKFWNEIKQQHENH